MLDCLGVKIRILKKALIFCIWLLSSVSYAQLHHQTIGALGGSQVKSNYHVSHSVGQSSVVGASQLSSTLISQGYQQAILNEYVLQSSPNVYEVKFYPNPFSTQLTFAAGLRQPSNHNYRLKGAKCINRNVNDS